MNTLPKSATSGLTAFTGLAAFLSSLALVYTKGTGWDIPMAALLVIVITASAILLVSIVFEKVHLRKSTGIGPVCNRFSLMRCTYKFLGLLGSFGFIVFFYWLFPEYHAAFYAPYYRILSIVVIFCTVAGFPYIVWVDRRMHTPHDGYWQMGKLITLQWNEVNFSLIGQHLLGWLVKGYFLPLMFVYFCDDLQQLLSLHSESMIGFKSWYDFLYNLFYLTDVGLVSMGYLLSLRIADTHLRSAEPTLFGWAVALVCYEPFWSFISNQYVNYGSGYEWGDVFSGSAVLYAIWGTGILILIAIYVWATVSFGASFSNLTNRGIITNGPYRYTKHPAYIAKNISWWMISMPFIVHENYQKTLQHCFLLLLLSTIYWLRAKTEEKHLSRDANYVNYALWIEKNGLFRFLNRPPVLKWQTEGNHSE